MGRFEEIKQVLRMIDERDSGFLDKLDDNAINQLQEVKDIRKKWRLKNFKVNRDNQTIPLNDGSKKNIGRNRLVGFKFDLIPDI